MSFFTLFSELAGFLFAAFVGMMFIVVILKLVYVKCEFIFLLKLADAIESASLFTGWPFVLLGVEKVTLYFDRISKRS